MLRIRTKHRNKMASLNKLTTQLKNRMVEFHKSAVGEFLVSAGEEIHVDTGMSKASLQPVARKVGYENELTIDPKRNSVEGSYDIRGIFKPHVPRSIPTGQLAGASAYRLVREGSKTELKLTFRYKINVYQWLLWEYQWKALENGRHSLIDFVKSNKGYLMPQQKHWIQER